MTAQFADRRKLESQRARAARGSATFLREAVFAEVQDRLNEVNRTFTAPAVVTGWPGLWAGWPAVVPDGPVVELTPGAHDLVVHDLSLHWADDPVGQLVQCRHALRPDGLMMATLFGGQTLHELRTSLAEAEIGVTGGLSPRVAPMGEIRDLGALLQRAGFALPVADSVPFDVSYETAFELMRDLRAMGEGNALAGRLRKFTRRQVMVRAAEIHAARFGRDNGRVRATFEVIVLTGWAPGPNQQEPMRPGTAAYRLADALGSVERPLDRGGD
jgi:SAM-dependent methyltransferase